MRIIKGRFGISPDIVLELGAEMIQYRTKDIEQAIERVTE